MRRPHVAIALLLAILLIGLAAPTASARATHDEFVGLYFPAGMPGTGTECPYTWVDPAFCVIDPGSWTEVDGRLRIRDITLFELAFSWRADDPSQVEPRKTGYDVVTASANLDATLSGPTWGTWMLYSFADELMFTGTFTGSFQDGIPAVHFVGMGTGQYEGQHMWGDIGRVPNPYNMLGQILNPGGA
ncbi:MAG: hypothetical protein M0Z49_16735 [Chloroflexi bacterium]|nr:hypothetical protein [Chloroflexota bacterium]MDA8237705.1 hypothetical protein [Chloroflexota bacterium]